MSNLQVTWIDGGHEPTQQPNPAYPTGIDLNLAGPAVASCWTMLKYPAPRIGYHGITCSKCGATVRVTTAGRKDDPRSVRIACKTQ